jgi:hypothetical protein
VTARLPTAPGNLADVSPRRNNPQRDYEEFDEARVRRGVEFVRNEPDGEWMVRHIPGDSSSKIYRCPGCDQEIPPGVAHVVAWPSDGWGDPGDRRHWHANCWRGRHQRRPNLQCGRQPRR